MNFMILAKQQKYKNVKFVNFGHFVFLLQSETNFADSVKYSFKPRVK